MVMMGICFIVSGAQHGATYPTVHTQMTPVLQQHHTILPFKPFLDARMTTPINILVIKLWSYQGFSDTTWWTSSVVGGAHNTSGLESTHLSNRSAAVNNDPIRHLIVFSYLYDKGYQQRLNYGPERSLQRIAHWLNAENFRGVCGTTEKRLLASPCLSVRLYGKKNSAATGWIFMKFYISGLFFENPRGKFKFH